MRSVSLQINYMMPGKKSIAVAGVILLLCVGASCKNKNKPAHCTQNPQNCKTASTAKNFFLFKEGTWWVYEEETSHLRDSIYVTNSYSGADYNFQMITKSALTDYEYHYYPIYAYGNTQCSATELNAAKCVFIRESKGKPGDYVGEGYCFFVNYKLNDELGSFNVNFSNNKIRVGQLLSNYSNGAFTFGETVKIHELAAVLDDNQPKNCYYARDIGLVRKELVDSNQVWNLVSYHIEP